MNKLVIALGLILASATSVFAMSYEQAKIQDKPVVVMFHMHGCGACQRYSPTFDKFASKFSEKFNFVKEDTSRSNIGRKLSFSTVPAFFIVDPKTDNGIRISDGCAWNNKCLTKTLNEY